MTVTCGSNTDRKWFPPIKLSKQVPRSASPKSWRSSMVWFTKPLPSPRLADWGSPKWIPKHSVELQIKPMSPLLSRLYGVNSYKPMARAKLTIPSSVRTSGELKPETTTCQDDEKIRVTVNDDLHLTARRRHFLRCPTTNHQEPWGRRTQQRPLNEKQLRTQVRCAQRQQAQGLR